MKKLLSALMMAVCVFGLTACSADKTPLPEEQQQSVQALCDGIYGMTTTEYTEDMLAEIKAYDEYEWEQIEGSWRQQGGLKITGDLIIAAIDSWRSTLPELGTVSGIDTYDFTVDGDGQTIAVLHIKGSEHDAEYEIVFDERMAVQSITINAQYSFGEQMGRAALNTLLGMGTVFAVLILISLIISCFTFIPKIQAVFAKKPQAEETKTAAVDNTIAQIIEKEELTDDTELIAVIAAAIAASEGAVSADGYVVRSIKRANRRI